jgi:hypothetical protein
MTISKEKFKEETWLEGQSFFQKLEEEKLKSIFYFSLIWNLFEKICCGGEAKMADHPAQISNRYAEQCTEVINPVWNHFFNRYIENGRPTATFQNFEFKPRDNKPLVEAILKLNERATNTEKLETLLRIAFRLRNNLFHGTKEIGRQLYEQKQNFFFINMLLANLIELHTGGRN